MHLLLTDRLTCPRCGPDFGLILLAHEVRDRRIIHGDFGCANCRETYPVEEGFGDLRPPPRKPLTREGREREGSEAPDPVGVGDDALRLAALMGVTEGPGTLLVRGPAAVHAPAVSRLIGGVEVVAVDPSTRWTPETEGVSRMTAGPGLPFTSSCLRAVVLSGPLHGTELREALRVLIPRGRVVVLGATAGARPELEQEGARVVLEEDGVLVAERERTGPQRLVTLRAP